MERTVPEVASEEIELYLRTYYSLLRTSAEVKLHSLVEAHAGMKSLLHSHARDLAPDMSALTYCLLRLPPEIHKADLVVMGQSPEIFDQAGIGDITSWQQVEALARRRRTFFDGQSRLAVLISSRSDIDDLIPLLTAYEIEWNKLHVLMRALAHDFDFDQAQTEPELWQSLADVIELSVNDLDKLRVILGENFAEFFTQVRDNELSLKVQLLNGSLTEYRRAIHAWWNRIETACPEIVHRPIYFVSSNAHSLINIITGFALSHQEEIVSYLENTDNQSLKQEWEDIKTKQVPSSKENFFYYIMKKYLNLEQGQHLKEKRLALEAARKILRVTSQHSIDIEVQILPVNQIDLSAMDPRLRSDADQVLKESDALILNIDYPLGFAAYHVLSEVAEHVGKVLGVYVMGKAATLNGAVGDVMIPGVIYDGHSRNSFLFPNCFVADDVNPYLVYGSVLDNQKSVSVMGTFLQNNDYMDVFYREGYTDIEMEGGPYLSAVYEMTRPKRHPVNEIVNLYGLPFDLGLMHYASDKPLSKGSNLGAANLSYFGMDPTYATTIAILRRIFEIEKQRLNNQLN